MLEINTPSMPPARRIPLPPQPTKSEEQRVERLQAEARKRIGQRVKRLRTEAGLTLRQLEMRSNVSATHVSAIERGLRSPTADILIRLGFYLGVDPSTFLSDQD